MPDPTDLRDKHLLIVDDSTQMTSLLRDVFASCGAHVTVANSGNDAVTALKTFHYDLVILDVTMPGLSGWDVLEHVGNDQPDLPHRTMLLTAGRYDDRTVEAASNGAVAVAYKPFDINELRVMAARRCNGEISVAA